MNTDIINNENKEYNLNRELKTEYGRISEVRKNSYKIRFGDQDLPAKLKGSSFRDE